MSAIFDGVATALGSVGLNSVANYLQGNQNVKNTNAINANQMQLNKQFQEWQYLNQPQLQVQGMKAAGMNPAMQGAVTNAGSASNGSAGTLNMNPNSGVTQDSLSNSLLVKSQQELNAAKADEARTQSGLNQANSKFISVQTNCKQFELDFLLPLEQEFKRLTNAKTEQEINEIKKNVELLGAKYQETMQNIDNLKAQKKLTDKQADLAVQQLNESIERVKTMQTEQAVNRSQVALNHANAAAARSQVTLNLANASTARKLGAYYDASSANTEQDTKNKKRQWLSINNEAAYNGELAKQAKYQTDVLMSKGVPYGVAKEVTNDILDAGVKVTETFKNVGLGVGGLKMAKGSKITMSKPTLPSHFGP